MEHYPSYRPLADELHISLRESGPWLVHGSPNHDQRWLICLSVCMRNADAIFRKVLPVLHEKQVPFLLIKNTLQHNQINNNAFPLPFYGKPLIAFVEDVKQAGELAAALAALTNEYGGLKVPGCIRVGSIVYVAFSRLNPDYDKERGEDSRQLPFILEVPHGSEKEFPQAKLWKEKKLKGIIGGRYLPVSLIASTPKGNILKGVDLKTFNWCFIKQAAAWAAEDLNGRQMSDRLRWQKEVSKELKEWIRCPEVKALVEQEDYTYLIFGYIHGKSLDQLIKSLPDNDDSRRYFISCFIQLLQQVAGMHKADFIHRDLTAKNILITSGGQVYLSDFELTFDMEKEEMIPFDSGTFGYMSPQQIKAQEPECSDDVYSLGALLYYMISRVHPEGLTKLPADERLALIDGLPAAISVKDAIRRCLDEDPQARPEIEELQEMLADVRAEENLRQAGNQFNILKQRLEISFALILLAALTVVTLWLCSDEPNSQNNGFTRKFISAGLQPGASFPLPANTRTIAGFMENRLYFSTTTPWIAMVFDPGKGTLSRSTLLNDPVLRSRLSQSSILQAGASGLAIFDGAAKLIILNCCDGKTPSVHPVRLPFTRALRFSQGSAALRVFNLGDRDQMLCRYDLKKDTILNENQLTEVKHDFGLTTSGYLDYDEGSQRLVYVSRYANHILLLDTLMQVIRRGRTIDTLSQYTLESTTEMGKSGGVVTNANPRKYVNHAIALSGGKLYVYSALKADNETRTEFMSGPVIDVYSTRELHYLGTYRLLGGKEGAALRSFLVEGQKLYAFYPGDLKVYTLHTAKHKTP